MQNKQKPTILVVDDTPDNITLLCSLLGETYRNKVATNGKRAIAIAEAEPHPDLILLDIMMPEMDGYEVCRYLKSQESTRNIPIIFLTAKTQEGDETMGFELGAVDYITKPITPAILLARVSTHLTLQEARNYLATQNEILEHQVEARTRQLAALQDAIITAMAAMAEARDNDTGHHILRTQHYIRELARQMSLDARYANELDEKMIDILFKSAPLHDIGKVGVPDRILLKPGKLTDEEFTEMKRHTIYGRDAIIAAEKKLDVPERFLVVARDIAFSHHEKWDGTGYPQQLAGEATPLSARLMALCDVYDALTTERVYKAAFPHEKATQIIFEGKGKHFDPDVVEAFDAIQPRFAQIAHDFAEHI